MTVKKNINNEEMWPGKLPDLDLSYRKSKEDVWRELSHAIDSKQTISPEINLFARMWRPIAASVIILLGMTLFGRFYTKEITSDVGQHITAVLPDGSKMILNAGSGVSYHPFWWRFDRKVELQGEAFFEVKKGKRFDVVSRNGITTVLGTSFNIYARNDHYQVTCYTGKVRVISLVNGHALNIIPGEQASLNSDGSFRLAKLKDSEEPVSWMNNMFVFTGTPLHLVFEEIERQYAVKIGFDPGIEYLYTGNFTRNQPVEQVLQMVCRPYGLDFEKTPKGYLIEKK
ncbi:FecR family protein [Thermophagus sp. OGC60D27]|uniref:FecR family protein n=1 Tax=Thermophagus sp. OGC60D27 TaxID=3458415 RepID=UPI004037F9AC